METGPGLFIAWEPYQRRAELLAPLLESELALFPNRMPARWLRPLDYAFKLVLTLAAIRRQRPRFAIAQAPPHFAALAPWWTSTPYMIDAHNGLFQSRWSRAPGVARLLRGARFAVVHNEEILEVAQRAHPEVEFHVVSDPLDEIRTSVATRDPKQILMVCSFDGDEPLEALVEVVERAVRFEFVITANPAKLPRKLEARLRACPNLRLTGYLPVADYQRLLCSSAAVIALTETEATQQSGACEALSSNTPLITSRSSLSESLFGDWALLVENTADVVVAALETLDGAELDLRAQLAAWNARVHEQARGVREKLLA